jgi:hypothetical protein
VVAKGRELDLLLTGGRLFLGNARDEEALECLGPALDWSRLLEMAGKEGMSGVLALQLQRLARTYRLKLPVEPFSQALHGTFASNGRIFAELLSFRTVLQEQGMRAIILKGGALTTTAYGGQLGLRPLSDLDLLVKESDLPIIRDALFERGFRAPSPSGMLFTNGPVMFDLHTDLINASRIRRRAMAFRFDPEAIWAKAVPLDPGDPSLLILSPAHQFLHLAVHGQKHSFSRLIWLVDLALISRRLDWEELLLQARNTGTLRSVAYALLAMEKLLGVRIPPAVWVTLPSLNRMERKFMEAVVSRKETEPAGELLVAFSIPSLPGKLGYLYEFTFPCRSVLGEVFPASAPGWFYARRIGQVLGWGWAHLVEALRWGGRPDVVRAASAPDVQ